jgi:hypothetical protein
MCPEVSGGALKQQPNTKEVSIVSMSTCWRHYQKAKSGCHDEQTSQLAVCLPPASSRLQINFRVRASLYRTPPLARLHLSSRSQALSPLLLPSISSPYNTRIHGTGDLAW